ncbi:MAG: methyltransferase domain-containing protein [Pseudomonadota bacterium]
MELAFAFNLGEQHIDITYGDQLAGTISAQNGQPQFRVNPERSPEEQRVIMQKLGEASQAMPDTLNALVIEFGAKRHADNFAHAIAQIQPDRRRQIHLGSGNDVRDGWLNVDFQPWLAETYHPDRNLLIADLRRGLKLPPNSAEVVYSSHFFEHLSFAEAQIMVTDCCQFLKPGGRFRAMLPNFSELFDATTNNKTETLKEVIDTGFLDFLPAQHRVMGNWMSRGIFEFGQHKHIWDTENLPLLLRDSGFTDIMVSEFDPDIDNSRPIRVRWSFFIDAIKA